mmetsp:Transcript_26862/g.51812  ORF Transcript_26862/g.51812 Transcript_26862/m.51812 type:complete len:83 (-) Transcript_26862:527-775(-)
MSIIFAFRVLCWFYCLCIVCALLIRPVVVADIVITVPEYVAMKDRSLLLQVRGSFHSPQNRLFGQSFECTFQTTRLQVTFIL